MKRQENEVNTFMIWRDELWTFKIGLMKMTMNGIQSKKRRK